MIDIDAREVLEMLDSTFLRADAIDADITELCENATEHEFAAVIVNPLQIKKARKLLRGSPVKVGTVIAFPLGDEFTSVKVTQTKKAIRAGAQDIDMVIAISQIKQGNWEYVAKDIKKVKRAARGKTLKVILETGLLSREEIVKAVEICVQLKVRFIKTGTGYNAPADLETVKLILHTIKEAHRTESSQGIDKDQNTVEVKASGGIKTFAQALQFAQAGVKRIGTSNAAAIAIEANKFKANLIETEVTNISLPTAEKKEAIEEGNKREAVDIENNVVENETISDGKISVGENIDISDKSDKK